VFPPKSQTCWARVRPALTAIVTLIVVAVLVLALKGKSASFTAALHTAPLGLLGAAAALQLLALLSRTEAWNVSVRAAGATVGRRVLFRAASVGSIASVANGQLSVAARIAVLRRSSPAGSPRVPALLGAEVPILATEAILAALTSFTLVGPLGLPWWLPLVCVAVTVLLGAGVCALAGRRRRGLCAGFAVLRSMNGRSRVVGLVLVAVLAQIARNYLILRSTGVAVSVFDSIAVLIAMVTISQLPLGPGVGAAATVLILGTHGVAIVAAAGVLLTATGTAGALCFAAWAAADWLLREGRQLRRVRSSGDGGAPERAYLRRPHQADLAQALYLPLAFSTRPRAWSAPAWA
jgi:uncharacterized membrane protein YbhN (UPF0104 family)